MQIIDIDLMDEYPEVLNHSVNLSGVIYDNTHELNFMKRKNVLILPGGGYEFISYREKDPIMFAFLSEGFNAFSLEYSCHTSYPTPYLEVTCAMHYINTHIDEFNLLPNSTSIIGFSAGGHLACTYGYLYKKFASDSEEKKLLKPHSIILGYPVTSLLKSRNDKCKRNISNDNPKLVKLLSVENHITSDYPPTFIFTTKTDRCVNPINTKWLLDELIKKKVKNKCMIYKSGPHGLALANHATDGNKEYLNNKKVSGWVKLASEFIYNLK